MNIKRKHIMILGVCAMLALAGCAAPSDSNSDNGQELAEDTGESLPDVKQDDSYNMEVKITEQNQQQLVRAQPAQVMESSLERQNLINRYEYLNDENNLHHVYLIDEGQVVSYFVAQGKVSSVNSKLTNDKQIVDAQRARFDNGGDGAGGAEGPNFKVVESPQMDGSYGTNGDAIFFFTASGEYVESSLRYVVSEEPRNIQDEVILRQEVNDSEDDDE